MRRYGTFRALDLLLIAIYQSLPLIYIKLLFDVREKLTPAASSPELAMKARDADHSINHVKFLFQVLFCSAFLCANGGSCRCVVFFLSV